MTQNLIGEAPTRSTLLIRLKDCNDQESWRLFFDTYWKLIYNAAIRAGLTDSEAQDVVQDTVIGVLKTMPRFEYDKSKGSFKGWLLRLTSWRIRDQFRKRLHQTEPETTFLQKDGGRDIDEEGDEEVGVYENTPNPANTQLDSVWEEEWEQNLMQSAIERVKRKVDPEQYQLFDLYVLKKWPVLKVARTFKVSAGKVYLIKHRITNLIKREIMNLRQHPI